MRLTKDYSSNSEFEKQLNLYAALSFLIITLGIGLPVWWKTTEVYRASLPYKDIEQLSDTKFILKFNLNLLYADEYLKHSVDEMRNHLQTEMTIRKLHDGLLLKFEYNAEILDVEYKTLLTSVDSIELFDSKFSADGSDDINVVFLTESHLISANDSNVYFGSCNNVFVRWTNNSLEAIVEKILLQYYLNERKLSEIFVKYFDKRLISKKTEKSRKNLKFSTNIPLPTLTPKYSMEFTLISPDATLNARQVNDVQTFFQFGFKSLSSVLANLTSLNFKSQILHFVDFEHRPKFDKMMREYYYESAHLPHLISAIESYTSALQTDCKLLRFLLYVTPENRRPLYVLNEKNEKSLDNGLIVTDWGGVLVLNPDISPNGSNFTLINKRTRDALFTQILRLLGFSVATPLHADWSIGHQSHLVPLWDLRRVKLEAILDFCAGTIATLLSLNKLLAEITNIVISNHVSDAIDLSVKELKKSVALINNSFFNDEVLNNAFLSAKIAREQSERAFFDPSLLSLLYFPDDQKYAIYVPLFLPVLLPVFMSVFSVVRYFKTKT